MGLTEFSFIELPLCLLWALQPERLLKLMVLAQVFEAAAALTVGSFGVQPGLVAAMIFVLFVLLQLLLGARYPGDVAAWRLVRPFVLVTVWALASSYVMPRLFHGQVYVWPQKEIPPYVIAPLEPSSSNINQDVYLAISCLLVVLVSAFLTRTRSPLLPFLRTFLWSGILVAVVSVWQFANKIAHVPYPSDLFYSNPGWALNTGQQFGALPRINGPFSEPAALASYAASIVCASGWLMLQGHRDQLARWAFVAALGTMFISTSTTGFAALAVVAVGIPVYALLTGSSRIVAMVLKVGVPIVVLLGLAFFAGDTLVPRFDSSVETVIASTLDKQNSSSYDERTSGDADSLQATIQTYGLGTGWGSNRSSSLLPGLLSTIGLPGVLGLLWFGVSLARRVRRARRSAASVEKLMVIDGCCGGIFGFLLCTLISGPTISSVTFYFLVALLVASVVRVELEPVSYTVRKSPREAYAVPAGQLG